MPVTANIILDTRRMQLKTKAYPVKLRVTFQRVPRDFPTVFNLSKEDYEKLPYPRLSSKLQEIKDNLKYIESNAENFIKNMNVFNFYEFERDFIRDNKFFKQKK